MRILFLSDASSLHTKRWVDYFVDRGYESYLFSLERSQGTKAKEIFISAKTRFSFLKYLLALPELKNTIEKIKPDLVNAHFIPNYGFLGALAKKRPMVVSTWGSDVLISPKKSVFHKLRAKYTLSKADLITCDGVNLVEEVSKLGPEKEKIIFAPMGIEQKLLMKREDSIEDKEKVIILSLRSLEPVYDLKTMIKSIPLILKKINKKIKFRIVGEGSQKKEFMDLCLNLNVEKEVEFKGRISREELEDVLHKADIYISTSLSDSTSVSLLEAMASGLVPVVSDIPGNREWIEEGVNGFLFPAGDYQALAQRIIWVINNFEDIVKLRGKNQKIIREKALWEENMEIVERRFMELLKI
ncbi:MAG: glycosyltransferase family 4 protein [candidate division Zixibacteria bacterium]|nr:glycosyltransferase family 4 protein [candidate division Zixibacteria bacterium]